MDAVSLFFFDLQLAFQAVVGTVGDWISATSMASPTGFIIVALAGMVMGLAPNMLPLAPVIFGVVSGGHSVEDTSRNRRLRGFRLSLAFALGMASVDAVIGIFFGILGYYVASTLAAYLSLSNLLLGVLLLAIGLALLRILRIRLPFASAAPRNVKTALGAYLLGIPFGLAVCPACTPLVLPVIAGISATGVPLLAGALLFTFGLGRGVPLVIVGSTAGLIKGLSNAPKWILRMERLGGALLIVAGLYYLYQSAVYKGLASPIGTFL